MEENKKIHNTDFLCKTVVCNEGVKKSNAIPVTGREDP
jgi:hypothetical protein